MKRNINILSLGLTLLTLVGTTTRADTRNYSGTSELDGSHCELKIEIRDNQVRSVAGFGYGRGWSIDIFGHCEGLCRADETIHVSSFDGGNLADPEKLAEFSPVIFYRMGSDHAFTIRGKRPGPDSSEFLKIKVTNDRVSYMHEVKTGLGSDWIPVAKKSFTCLL